MSGIFDQVINYSPSTISTGGVTSVFGRTGAVVAVSSDYATAGITGTTITTPVIAQINDANGNETLKLASIASAVNEVTIENAATGNAVHISATGGDASVGLHLAGKGASGYVNVQDSTDATKRIMFNASGGTTNTRTMLSSTQTVDRTLSLPDATDTLVGKATTDTLTNKTITGGILNGTLGATTPSTVAATTISASGKFTIGAGTFSAGDGSIYFGSASGIALIGKTGTTYDIGVYSAAGQNLLSNPTGTANVWLGNAGGGGTVSAKVAMVCDAGLAVTGTVSATGTLTLARTGNDAVLNFQNSNTTEGQIECYAGEMFYQTQTAGKNHVFRTDAGTVRATISSTGLAVTGAITSSSTISLNYSSPRVEWYDTSAAADAKRWDILSSGGVQSFRLVNDANSAANTWLQVNRTGYASATVAITGNTAVTGDISATGRITTNDSAVRSGLTNATVTAVNTSTVGSASPSLYVENNSDTGNGALMVYAKGSRSGTSSAIQTKLDGTTTDYHIIFVNDNGVVGSISTNASATTYNTSSDYRLKNITGPLVDSGTFIDALKPKIGTWKADGSKFVGFIAHEFAEVSPVSVTGEKDAVDADGKPINQSMQASTPEVMANIIAELQSLRKRLAALESK
jgi:hypothetical protein